MLKILVVCSQNKLRSPTAEAVYRHDRRFFIRSAGLSQIAPHRLSYADLEWADLLLYMEKDHLERIKHLFHGFDLPKSMNLDIPDQYQYMDQELVEILKEKIEAILKSSLP